ncbi:hypothetical protein [Mitsuaria sp. 7]|uniref:hypothetical protein n=1 Tax=Mitsuaria sp. 7 TaxID=1658665 RepID=UPI0007DDE010|nr:hypothetical protein [Mitsuaria sp. 7]ANH67616.1 hypothetical protein ABE85_08630 [Mitsuaria sp. 7]
MSLSPPNPPIALLRRSSSTPGRRSASAPPVAAPRVASQAANDADFKARDQDHTVLRLRDLHIAPTPLFFAMLACAVPLLMLGAAAQSLESATVGALLLLAALGCLWHGVETLRGLELRCAAPLPCFAGDRVMVALDVTNPAGRSRWDIAVTLGSTAMPAGNGWIDVAPRSRRQVLMPLVANGRGRQGLPLIRLETQHPFGLVDVSAFWAPRRHLLVTERPAVPPV